jgi:hypothetical protein
MPLSIRFPIGVPTAAIWLNLARLLNTGKLPDYAPLFMTVFGSFCRAIFFPYFSTNG